MLVKATLDHICDIAKDRRVRVDLADEAKALEARSQESCERCEIGAGRQLTPCLCCDERSLKRRLDARGARPHPRLYQPVPRAELSGAVADEAARATGSGGNLCDEPAEQCADGLADRPLGQDRGDPVRAALGVA